MRGLAWLRRGWAAVKRMYPALAAALVVAALAATLYGVSQARQRAQIAGASSSASVATATAAPTASTTTQPPLSGPTPTPPSNEQLIPPSNGTGPFAVQSVVVLHGCVGNCTVVQVCSPGLPTFIVGGEIWLAPNAPSGDVTYRWLPSYGSATAPAVIHFGGGIPNVAPFYTLTPGMAMSGQPFSVRLEVLSPTRMISPPSDSMSFICMPLIKSIYVSPAVTVRSYDCQAGGTQTFAYTGSIDIAPSPSYSISYYWKRSDGSVSPTRTITTTLGETSISLLGDAISLTAPSPPPPVGPSPIAYYGDTLVVLNPAGTPNGGTIKQFTLAGAEVIMPNCSDTFAPTPTATTAPTATPAPTATLAPTATP